MKIGSQPQSASPIGVVLVVTVVLLAGRAAAEDGITVIGAGEVLAKPDRVEIDLRAGASAELSGDAIAKYRDSVRRVTAAFEKLEMKNLTVEPREVSFASATVGAGGPMAVIAAAGGQAQGGKAQTDIHRSVRLVLRGVSKLPEEELVETIGRLVDTAKDAGATVGDGGGGGNNALLMRMMGEGASSSPLATFAVENAEKLRDKAYEQAFAQAEARAGRLARLAKCRLGRALSVQEIDAQPAADGSSAQERIISTMYGLEKSPNTELRLTSDKLGEIPVRVGLRVRFELIPETEPIKQRRGEAP